MDFIKREPQWESAEAHLVCEACGCADFDDGGGDGFRYCVSCGSQSQLGVETATLDEDVHGISGGFGGGLYNLHHHRANPTSASAFQPILPSKEKILEGLSQAGAVNAEGAEDEVTRRRRSHGFLDEEEPRNFAVPQKRCTDPEELASGIRRRYVEGLQVMLQLQCEALVERFGVSPLICGMAGTVWLRYVAATRVFDKEWAKKAIAESEAAGAQAGGDKIKEEPIALNQVKAKHRSEPRNSHGQRSVYIWFRSLRKMIPVYSSLAISFLVCHLAREAILPTDLYHWALEGKLPYLSAFSDINKILGDPAKNCPLSSRFLFRPFRVIGTWQLEATAGSVAESIGLRLPSVNFNAIAFRYLKELDLPVDKILPHACRLYAWSLPADLWLSSNIHSLPTRVCVMSILIVTIRILYSIHGQGKWEMSLSNSSNSSLDDQSSSINLDSMNVSSAQNFIKIVDDAKESQIVDGAKESQIGDDTKESQDTMGMPLKNLAPVQTDDFSSKELLDVLEAAYDRICISHDYSKDLRSYLEFCKDVVFAGLTTSYNEERLIERLWDTYNKQEDNGPLDDFIEDLSPHISFGLVEKKPELGCSSTAIKSCATENMKINMEENGFHYLPPRKKLKSDGYLLYKRQRIDGKLLYVAHADYYILLRACAKLAQVDARIMHLGALKLEKRLAWLEAQIGSFTVQI